MNITSRILQLIFEHQPVSQSNLRDLSGFSVSTISSTVKRLMMLGIIRELGQRKKEMGRPHTLLSIDPNYAAVLGVQLNAERSAIVMTDFTGNLISEQRLPHGPIEPTELANYLARFVQRAGSRRIVGVGLAIAGVIDSDAGMCMRSTVLDWDNVPIAEILSVKVKLPVYVENDANALAQATLLFGHLPAIESAVVASLGTGIGSGIIIGRHLYRGRSGNAGEIGHIKVTDVPTPVCRCGQTGCLESIASLRGIAHFVAEATQGEVRLNNLREADNNLRPEITAILARAGDHLGRMLADLALIFDPDTVYLAMEPDNASPYLLEQTIASFQSHRVTLTRRPTPLHILPEWDKMWAIGAASIAIGRCIAEVDTLAIAASGIVKTSPQHLAPGAVEEGV